MISQNINTAIDTLNTCQYVLALCAKVNYTEIRNFILN